MFVYENRASFGSLAKLLVACGLIQAIYSSPDLLRFITSCLPAPSPVATEVSVSRKEHIWSWVRVQQRLPKTSPPLLNFNPTSIN